MKPQIANVRKQNRRKKYRTIYHPHMDGLRLPLGPSKRQISGPKRYRGKKDDDDLFSGEKDLTCVLAFLVVALCVFCVFKVFMCLSV